MNTKIQRAINICDICWDKDTVLLDLNNKLVKLGYPWWKEEGVALYQKRMEELRRPCLVFKSGYHYCDNCGEPCSIEDIKICEEHFMGFITNKEETEYIMRV